jgi:hypothetical protein
MPLPDIDFSKIRPHEGSQLIGFEELCCQLASLEDRPAQSVFYRKGPGADAGVECFVRHPDGAETGWQSKYFADLGRAQIAQLDKSIGTALTKHPNLARYIVCLPFNLRDERVGKKQSQLERWENWKRKWLDKAKRQKRQLDIELWGKSTISERLNRDEPLYSGKLTYWFNQGSLTPAWFRHEFDKARKGLGERYTPEVNVELPIRQTLLGFARDLTLDQDIQQWFDELEKARYNTVQAMSKLGGTDDLRNELNARLVSFVQALAQAPFPPDAIIPVDQWQTAAGEAHHCVQECLNWVWKKKTAKHDSPPNDPAEWVRSDLYRLASLLHNIRDELQSERWQAVNAKHLLIYGDAGVGKSHLFADAAKYQVDRKRPALLVLNSALIEGEPWQQVLEQLNLHKQFETKTFLGALDAAAQATGTRAVIFIDAINERHGLELWPSRLGAFMKEADRFPRVVIAFSCRTTYIDYIIPMHLQSDLLCIEHLGFQGHASEAARIYLDKRGIVRPGAPSLVPEFENPLFLKTCCDALEKQGTREFPRGLRGVTQIFDFYNSAVADSLQRRMKLDPHQGIPRRAIDAFAEALAEKGSEYLSKDEASALFEEILPSLGRHDRSLLTQLEGEGVLTIEPAILEQGERGELVSFTFQRFSDHRIAERLLDEHLDVANARTCFNQGKPLYNLMTDQNVFLRAGSINAIAIQLPERAELEILDAINLATVPRYTPWMLETAFMESLLWRDQRYFTERTLELLENLGESRLNDTLVSITTEPDNQFNALFLHERLMSASMPERDEHWSTWVALEDNVGGSSIETLITWALAHGAEFVEADRAELAAIMLTWLFSTSNRAIRDRATKALASLLAPRLDVAADALSRFQSVNDLCVLERLLASIYGAALQGLDDDGLPRLATMVFDSIFAEGKPPMNVLLRDHARGIIEYAHWRGVLPDGVDLARARPPYSSPWSIEAVPDELIESYTEERGGHGPSADSIVSSTVKGFGDFGNYIIQPYTVRFSPAHLDINRLPTDEDIYRAWRSEFDRHASPEQMIALDELLEAASAVTETRSLLETHSSPREQLKDAESRFRDAIEDWAWEDYRVRARLYIHHHMYSGSSPGNARFSHLWARRWVCKQAHELGWTPERFADFDRRHGISGDRRDHRIERIGKKYQWLALYELLARMADNLAYIPDRLNNGTMSPYDGPWQCHVRNIDPSLLVTRTHYEPLRQWNWTWWVPFEPVLKPITPEERLGWLADNTKDLINSANLINVTDSETGRRWLVLNGFSDWHQSRVVDGEKQYERDTWFRLTCIVVKKNDEKRLLRSLRHRSLRDPLPSLSLNTRTYVGEYPWHPALQDMGDWKVVSARGQPSVLVRPTVANYLSERGGYDYSLDEDVNVLLPAPWLIQSLDLHLFDGRKLTYVGKDGQVKFFDPSVSLPGPSAALVDRSAFLHMLERERLSAVWVIAGEKGVFGGREPAGGFGGRLVHTFVYQMKNAEFVPHEHFEREEPTAEQLKQLLGYSPGQAQKRDRGAARLAGASKSTSRPKKKTKVVGGKKRAVVSQAPAKDGPKK